MTTFPTPQPGQGATNMPNPNPSATEGGRAVSGDLSGPSELAMVRALAALLEPEAFAPDIAASPEWREPTQAVALNHAAKVITSGYRLVSEDDTTVDRVAAELADVDGYLWPEEGEEEAAAQAGLSRTIANVDYYRDRARAAIRALREAGE